VVLSSHKVGKASLTSCHMYMLMPSLHAWKMPIFERLTRQTHQEKLNCV